MSFISDDQTAETLQIDPNAAGSPDDTAPYSEAARALPPSLRERYENLHLIGEGAMGAVFRGWDPQLGRAVAIKLLKGDDPDDTRRFLQEAKAQARIQHANVCHVYDAGMADGEPYIAMEFIQGSPLDRAKAGMSLEQKVKVVREVAAALHEAHRLGLIHRDIKPSNIMIATDEDGAIKPFVVDFGLAREVTSSGESIYNMIAGTPAYMSPEQAEGTTAALDRRSDVYSLGATLYELLAGRTPFVGSNAIALLTQVMLEDAPSLRVVRRDVPSELETIVMTCLQRDPSQRYESARALGEDLQRFLDGEPIQAKRASLAYVLFSKARKNKAAVIIAAIGLCVALVLSGLWVRASRRASEQARLGRELGEDVKYVELFLRSAYGFPAHDIERENRIIRTRIDSIKKRMDEAGVAGQGPGHYALGRGFLALHDYEQAKTELDQALAVGYERPEVHYALGLTLGALYLKAIDNARRIADRTTREAAVKQADANYRNPAVRHLKESGDTEVESKLYIDGLVALYENRYEDAAAQAVAAFEDAPWLYEAKKLEGDALSESGVAAAEKGGQEEARRLLTRAVAAYTTAAEMATSDATIHGALAEAWLQILILDTWAGREYQSTLESTLAACDNAIKSAPANPSAFSKKSRALYQVGEQKMRAGEDPRPTTLLMIENALITKNLSPNDAIAEDDLGNAYALIARYELKIGLNPLPTVERATQYFEAATRIQPTFAWAWNDAGVLQNVRAVYEYERGLSPRHSINKTVELLTRASSEDPTYLFPLTNMAYTLAIAAMYEFDSGRDPRPDVALALRSTERALELNPESLIVVNNGGWAQLLSAQYEQAAGEDPSATLDRTEASFQKCLGLNKDDADTYLGLATALHTRALYAIRHSADPTEALEEAQRLLVRATELDSVEPLIPLELGRLAMTMARHAKMLGKDATPHLDEANLRLQAALKIHPRHARLNATYAELIALRAEYAPERKAEAQTKQFEIGLAAAEKALTQNPNLALAMAARGALYTARARLGKGKARKEDAQRAVESLEKAFATNPLLPERFKEMRTLAREWSGK